MLSPDVCVRVGSSGLDPSGGFRLPDVDGLDAATRALRQHAEDYLSSFCTATAIWRGLSRSYVAAESATAVAAFDHLTPKAQRVHHVAVTTAAALAVFSSTCRELTYRLEAYGRRVHALDEDIEAFPTSGEKATVVQGGQRIITTEQRHWTGEADLTARYNRLSAEVEEVRADYLSAQYACAGTLAAVSSGPVYFAGMPSSEVDLRSGSVVDEVLYDAGTFFGAGHAEQRPWGNKTVPYRAHDVAGLLQGFGAGAIELVDGIWSLIPAGNMTKVDRAWGGISTMAGAAGTLASSPRTWWDKDYAHREASKIRQATELFESIPASFAHIEDGWTNVGWAIGGGSFNTLSGVYTAGAGVVLKGGTLVSKAGLAAEQLSIATMDSARFGAFSAKLGAGSAALLKTGEFLDKPGSLALKVSDLLMPNITAKAQAVRTKASVATWAALTTTNAGVAQTVTGVKHTAASSLDVLADGIRTADAALPKAAFPDPHGVMTRTAGHPGVPDKLDHWATSIRESNPPAYQPRTATTAAPRAPFAQALADKFPKPAQITNTVTIRHGDPVFPIHRKENFAARTTLALNTEYVVEHRRLMKSSTGEVDTPTIEKYYTDGTGTVTRVDTYAGVKGAWSPELNKPMPNVTYNVIAEVDGGLRNTFTLVMDHNAHLASAKGHITSTLVGDMNRNSYQQLKTGRLGGPGYDGGHPGPSALGFIGERAGLFPHHEWQNRKTGTPNETDESNNFHDIEMEVINRVKRHLTAGESVELTWNMDLMPGEQRGLPSSLQLEFKFGDEDWQDFLLNNVEKREG